MASAGLGRRLLALLYEGLLLVALALVAGFALAPIVSPPESAATHTLGVPGTFSRVIAFLSLVALGALFYVWSWSEGRRTLPMKTWQLALVTVAGQPVSRRRALARYAAFWIGPMLGLATYALLQAAGWGALALPLTALNYLAALVDPDRAFLHDRLAGTRLVVAPR